MEKVFSLQIVTPDHTVFEGKVQKIFLKNVDGNFEIMAHHEKIVTSTIPAITKFVDENGNEKELFLSSSIVQVVEDKVTICADAAEFPEDIDFKRANESKKRSIEKLKNADRFEKEIIKRSLLRAEERLKLQK